MRGQFICTIALFLISLPFAARALCVSAKVANLRAGPSSKNKVTWTVGKYTPLVAQKWKRRWAQVKDQDGELHWVFGGLVSSSLRCMAVKRSVANVRTGPGVNFPLYRFSQLDRYTPLKRMERRGEWYNVMDAYGHKYWIHESNIWRPVKITSLSF